MLSVNQFRANLKQYVDQSIKNHQPIKVNRKNGGDFVVVSLEDYEREQETLYVLNNTSLMTQIKKSLTTYQQKDGYQPTEQELNLDSTN